MTTGLAEIQPVPTAVPNALDFLFSLFVLPRCLQRTGARESASSWVRSCGAELCSQQFRDEQLMRWVTQADQPPARTLLNLKTSLSHVDHSRGEVQFTLQVNSAPNPDFVSDRRPFSKDTL